MKLIVERSHLYAALSVASKALDPSNAIPMTKHLRLTAASDKLAIDATDFDLMLSTEVPAEVVAPGAVAVPAAALWDLVRFAPEGSEVSLDFSGERMTFRAGKASANLVTMPATDFPDIAQGSRTAPTTRFRMQAETMARMLAETEWAMASNESDWTIYGLHWHIAEIVGRGRRLAFVACNRHEIARVDMAPPEGAETLEPLTIPRKAVGVLAGMLGKAKGDVEIAAEDNSVTVTVGATRLSTKLIAAPFVPYDRVIPAAPTTIVRVERGLLSDLVSRVGAFASERKTEKLTWYVIDLDFDPDGAGAPLVRGISVSQMGAIRDEIDAAIEGPHVGIAIDPKRLAAALKALPSHEITLGIIARGQPIVMTESGRDDFMAVLATKVVAAQVIAEEEAA